VTHKEEEKKTNNLWIIIIPMMDLENRQTNTDIRTNKTNKKNERERAMFKSQEKKTKFF